MEETRGQRVFRLREAKGLGQKELGHIAGRSESWVSKLEADQIADPGGKAIAKVAAALGVTVEYLNGTESPPQWVREVAPAYDAEARRFMDIGRDVVKLVERRRGLYPRAVPSVAVRRLPIVNNMAADQANRDERQVEDTLDVPEWMIAGAADPVIFCVTGDCLSGDRIFNGDYMIVDRANQEPREGQIVAVAYQGGETAKHFHRVGDRIELRPSAPGYPTIEVAGELTIIGTYVYHLPGKQR